MQAVRLSPGWMLVQMQILKQNPGNGQFEAVGSGSQPFSVCLGKPGPWVRERWMLGCWVSSSRALPVVPCPVLPCWGKTLTRTRAKQLRACFALLWVNLSLCLQEGYLTPSPWHAEWVYVLVGHSKTFPPACRTLFPGVVATLTPSQADPDSKDLAVRT